MRKKLLVVVSSFLLALPTCLNIDPNGLIGLGEELACEIGTSGLPFSEHVDYCSVIDFDFGEVEVS